MTSRPSNSTSMGDTQVMLAAKKRVHRLNKRELSVLFWLGVAFLVVDLGSFLLDKVAEIVTKMPHEHTWIEYAGRALLMTVGLFLVMPKQTLELLMTIPLPSFLQRGQKP